MASIKSKPFNVNQIKIISQSLLHSYEYKDGFPVLKELIQNADDAESTELRIHYFEGIPSAQNELLRRKGILIYDNGKFSSVNDVSDERESNEYGVLSIGGTDKDDDIEKIGKYGLGMKSIFHICDAFFYYINKEERLGAINPFANSDGIDTTHPTWSELVDDDQNILIAEIKKVIPEKKGFTILIPDGMQEEHQIIANNGKRDIDINHPFNKGDKDNKNLIENLSVVLSLLPKVSTHKNNFSKIIINTPTEELISTADNLHNCIINSINGNTVSKTKYSFFETNDFILPEGEEIREYLKDNNAISSDKITSNHSVFYELLKYPKKSEHAKLSIKYCVYLPLQKPEDLYIQIDSDYDYTILINGSFLIDEGRKGVESFDFLTQELTIESIKKSNIHNPGIATDAWNKLIAQYIVFPNLPANIVPCARSNKKAPGSFPHLREIVGGFVLFCVKKLFAGRGVIFYSLVSKLFLMASQYILQQFQEVCCLQAIFSPFPIYCCKLPLPDLLPILQIFLRKTFLLPFLQKSYTPSFRLTKFLRSSLCLQDSL